MIAVNPYQWLNPLYSKQNQTKYAKRLVWETHEKDARLLVTPHVYEVSALAYKGLMQNDLDQSILVSGESGAGKTETVKICLSHIARMQYGDLSKKSSIDPAVIDPIVQCVVQSNPLLEAFGNAKTRRNDNSSRFGKYLQLQFDRAGRKGLEGINIRCALIGSRCDVYLLEKNRVVKRDPEERTYHIFYQLLAADQTVKTQFWHKLKDTTTESFSYVGYTDTNTIEGVSDRNRFFETLESLKLVGVVGDKLDMLIKAVCVVLQLGNLAFSDLDGDCDKSMVATQSELTLLAELMGVCEAELTLSFTERTFVTANETHKVPLNPEMAKDACDALAKELYQKIFLWLNNTINNVTSKEANEGEIRTIGLLDIFGFETYEINRFEQLCINYANEKLQQKFTEDIFSNVLTEYKSEGIALAEIWFDDNSDVLELIEGPTGLIALLNEECLRPKGNDAEFVHKSLTMNKNSQCILVNKMDRVSFGIRHYSGVVVYDARQFVSKNVDTLPTDLQACTEKSLNIIINTPRLEANYTSTGPRNVRVQSNIAASTVWTKYRRQLVSLMINLKDTQSRYIRCIKPNSVKKPLLFEHKLVTEQLRCAGVVAGITISRSAFPNRLPNQVVLARFSDLCCDRAKRSVPKGDAAYECRHLLELLLQDYICESKDGFQIKPFAVGKTKTYFRAGVLEYLESCRVSSLDGHATRIQKVARGWLSRIHARTVRQIRLDEELARERALREEAERRAKLAKEVEERRRQHAMQVDHYEKLLQHLKKATQAERHSRTAQLKEIHEKIEARRNECEELQKNSDELEDRVSKEGRMTKARQETRIAEMAKLIDYLNTENKRLRKVQAKYRSWVGEMTENSERLEDNLFKMQGSLSNLDADSFGSGEKNKFLKKRLEETIVRNKELRAKVSKYQDKYMSVAEERLSLQKTLAKVLTILYDKSLDEELIEEISFIAHSAETEAKCIMSSLDVETTDEKIVLNHRESMILSAFDFTENTV